MARMGATAAEVSEALGISVPTFHEWRRTHSEFSDALKSRPNVFDKARPEVNDAAVERAMIKCALGFNCITEKIVRTRMGGVVRAHSVYKPPSVRVAHFMLRARMPALYGRRRENPSDSSFLKALTLFNKSVANAPYAAPRRSVGSSGRWRDYAPRILRWRRRSASPLQLSKRCGARMLDFPKPSKPVRKC